MKAPRRSINYAVVLLSYYSTRLGFKLSSLRQAQDRPERSEASGLRMGFLPCCECEILRCAQNDNLRIVLSKLYLCKSKSS